MTRGQLLAEKAQRAQRTISLRPLQFRNPALSIFLQLDNDDLHRLRPRIHVGVLLVRRIGAQPHRLARGELVRIHFLAVFVDDVELTVRQRDERAAVIVTMQGERLLWHHDRLPDFHIVVLELRLATRRLRLLLRPHHAAAGGERQKTRGDRLVGKFHESAPMGESHERYCGDRPWTASKNICCSLRVMGPGFPSPTVRPSTSLIGVISTAVPEKNTSSASSRSMSVIGRISTGTPESRAMRNTLSRVMPGRIDASRSLVISVPSRTMNRFAPDPSETSFLLFSRSASSNPRRMASCTARTEFV